MKPLFAADVMVVPLAKWLRTAGFDTTVLDEKDLDASFAKAAKEGRWLLTRRRNAKFDGAGVIFLDSDGWRSQFATIMNQFTFREDDLETLVRCNRCNVPLTIVGCDQVKNLVPNYVFKQHRHFHQCTDCKRVYWMGSHIDRIKRELTDVFIYHLFRCNHCNVHVKPNEAKYKGQLKLESVYQPLEISDEDIMDEQEAEAQIEDLLESINNMSEEELNEAVAVIHDFTLCGKCHRKFLDMAKEFLKLGEKRLDG